MDDDVIPAEIPLIKKDTFTLTNERFNTAKTSMLAFHFEPQPLASPEARLKKCELQQLSVEGRDIHIFDHYFNADEDREMREYSQHATFSRTSYASHESREEGEEPALSMNNKEKWEFFAHPPQAVKELYKLLGFLSYRLEADISTLPWDLCDPSICASAVATNRLEKSSKKSMELGKHQDYSTEKGIPFGIPILYSKDQAFYDSKFVNGELGKPLLVSLMIYAAKENFKPSYGMGTAYYKKDGNFALRSDCKHMRFVIFEGDILHSIEASNIPSDINVWRVSYVFKLIINPKKEGQSMRQRLRELIIAG